MTALAGGAALWALSAQAVQIQYELTPLGGNDYSYTYTVVNDGLPGGAAVQWFDIGFDPTLYDEGKLIAQVPPGSGVQPAILTPNPLHSQWLETLLASVTALNIPVLYDAYGIGLGSSIPANNSATGFAVKLSWLGAGSMPGSQPYWIYTENTTGNAVLLASGTTVLKQPFQTPEPGILSLIVMGLTSLGVMHGRRRQ